MIEYILYNLWGPMGAVYALLILFIGVCLYIIPSTFTQPEAVVEGTPFEGPVRYTVMLIAPCTPEVWKILRDFLEIPLIDAKKMVAEVPAALLSDVSHFDVSILVNTLLNREPEAQVRITNNKFLDTYTIKEWKEFHNDRS
jgi:hypothetical protein